MEGKYINKTKDNNSNTKFYTIDIPVKCQYAVLFEDRYPKIRPAAPTISKCLRYQNERSILYLVRIRMSVYILSRSGSFWYSR